MEYICPDISAIRRLYRYFHPEISQSPYKENRSEKIYGYVAHIDGNEHNRSVNSQRLLYCSLMTLMNCTPEVDCRIDRPKYAYNKSSTSIVCKSFNNYEIKIESFKSIDVLRAEC